MFRFGSRIRRIVGYYPQEKKTIENIIAVAHYPGAKLLYLIDEGFSEHEYRGVSSVETSDAIGRAGTTITQYVSGYDEEIGEHGSGIITGEDANFRVEIIGDKAIIYRVPISVSTETIRRVRTMLRRRIRG